MAIFGNIISGLSTFNANAWAYVAAELNNNSEAIAKINTDRLYTKGKDSEDKPLRNKLASYKVYSPGYTKKKKRLGLYNGHVNLKLSGEYLDSYELRANESIVEIDVNPGNADLNAVLQYLYGLDIQGLTEKEWNRVVSTFIIPRLLLELNKAFK
jgi:hypothetical protein